MKICPWLLLYITAFNQNTSPATLYYLSKCMALSDHPHLLHPAEDANISIGFHL